MLKVCKICRREEIIPNTEHKAGVTHGVCSEKCLARQKQRTTIANIGGNHERYTVHHSLRHPDVIGGAKGG